MKAFMREFKEFITKGDVMSMAIGIIIGGAFTAIVNSLVGDVLSPIIGLIIGGLDFSGLSFGIDGAQIMYGNFIQAVITFLITAWVLFVIMKAFNRMMNLGKHEEEKAEEPAPAPEPEPSNEEKLLMEIRDLLKEK